MNNTLHLYPLNTYYLMVPVPIKAARDVLQHQNRRLLCTLKAKVIMMHVTKKPQQMMFSSSEVKGLMDRG